MDIKEKFCLAHTESKGKKFRKINYCAYHVYALNMKQRTTLYRIMSELIYLKDLV